MMGETPFLDIVVEDDALKSALRSLSQNVRNKVLRPALRKAMRPVLKSAKAAAPVKTGNLKKRIKVYVNRAKANGEVYAVIKATAPHAHLNEYGTKHQPARPFVRPAMDAHKEEALNTIAETLQNAWNEVSGR